MEMFHIRQTDFPVVNQTFALADKSEDSFLINARLTFDDAANALGKFASKRVGYPKLNGLEE